MFELFFVCSPLTIDSAFTLTQRSGFVAVLFFFGVQLLFYLFNFCISFVRGRFVCVLAGVLLFSLSLCLSLVKWHDTRTVNNWPERIGHHSNLIIRTHNNNNNNQKYERCIRCQRRFEYHVWYHINNSRTAFLSLLLLKRGASERSLTPQHTLARQHRRGATTLAKDQLAKWIPLFTLLRFWCVSWRFCVCLCVCLLCCLVARQMALI